MSDELDYINVVSEEGGGDLYEFPKEADDTVYLSTIQAQFPDAIGLKYRSESGAWRGLSAKDNVFAPPKGGWGDITYILTQSDLKRKSVGEIDDASAKRVKVNSWLQDMVVMNLPFSTSSDDLKDYFEKNCGPVDFCEVKKFHDTGKSRGYGFIRFKDEDSASSAVACDHYIDGRKVQVRRKEEKPMKLFVGRLPGGTTVENLKEYFSQFGEVTDAWIPTPFRNFGFITYASTRVAKEVMTSENIFNGSKLNIVEREPDRNKQTEERTSSKPRERNDFDRNARSSRSDPKEYSNNSSSGSPGMDNDLKKLLIQVLQNS